MSYISSQPHKCLNCGHEFLYSPHEKHQAPVTATGDHPACPTCWDKFLESIGLGYCTVPFRGGVSEYDQAIQNERADLKEDI